MLAALLGISTSAFAQGWIGPAYVTRVVEGDFIYAMFDRRIEALRYLGIDVPIVDHLDPGLTSYQVTATSPGRRRRDGSPFSFLRG